MMQHSRPMKRRGLLKLGLGGAVVLAAAGGTAAWLTPKGWRDGRLSGDAAAMWRSIALAVLDALVPPAGPAREAALAAWQRNLEQTLAALPAHAQAELAQLCTLLPTPPGRWALAGMRQDWSQAPTSEVAACLQALRTSRLAVRQQLFHALRDLSNAAWFSEPAHWAATGYPGPMKI
jgi:hypothetical protein